MALIVWGKIMGVLTGLWSTNSWMTLIMNNTQQAIVQLAKRYFSSHFL
jgi:hypothetical protein